MTLNAEQRWIPAKGKNPKLPYVKWVRSRGRLFAYFYMGLDVERRRVHVPLPAYGDNEFYRAYARCINQRPEGKFAGRKIATPEVRKSIRKIAEESLDRSESLFVYFIESPISGAIKIGKSVDPTVRIETLQIGHSEPLVLLAAIPGTSADETAYHKRFKEHRMRGEWFSPHPDILAEIERINSLEQTTDVQPLVKAG